MRKFILLLTLMTGVLSCSVNEKPVFVAVEDIQLVNANSKTVTLKADAIFQNPNDVGGLLESDAISVYIDNIKVAHVSSKPFKVPAKKEFTIPLQVDIDTDSIFTKNSSDDLASLFNSLLNQQIIVHYKGEIIYKTLGFSYTYLIDETELVTLKF